MLLGLLNQFGASVGFPNFTAHRSTPLPIDPVWASLRLLSFVSAAVPKDVNETHLKEDHKHKLWKGMF